jgi:membrane-bound lytic murein transglycosylase D
MFRIPLKRIVARRKIETVAIAAVAAVSSATFFPRDAFLVTSATSVTATPVPLTITLSAPPAAPATNLAPAAKPFARSSTGSLRVVSNRTAGIQATMGLPNLDNPRVDAWIKRFTTSQRGSFATYLRRKDRYDDMITKKLADRGMPQGLVYLAMIESGFNPTAKSPVAARGLWQFMSPTAREYGLKVTRRVDERTNPTRSTDAALKYLNTLYNRFGSWYLAAAAYNTGQGRVARVLKQVTGKTKGTDADYYRIAHRLPQETRDYVPKMIAAARIGTNPERYGFGGD